jgi:hypothetical protein
VPSQASGFESPLRHHIFYNGLRQFDVTRFFSEVAGVAVVSIDSARWADYLCAWAEAVEVRGG